MEATRKRQRTYGHGQPPEHVEGDEAWLPIPVGRRRLLLRRGLRTAGLDVGLARGQKRVGGCDGDDADLALGLGCGRGLFAFDEFVHLHLVDERKMDRRNGGEREQFSSPSKTERRRSRRTREGERFRGIR